MERRGKARRREEERWRGEENKDEGRRGKMERS